MTNIDMVFGAEVAAAIRTLVNERVYAYKRFATATFIADLLTGWEGTLLVFDPNVNQEVTATVENVAYPDSAVSFRVILKYGSLRIPIWDDVNRFCINATDADLAYYCAPIVIPFGVNLFPAENATK